MAERAYSIEIKKEITAKKASELSQKGDLLDSKNFYCIDPNCAINLTCTNWNRRGKKYYFTPSSKDDLHIVGCTQISASEAKEQSKREAVGAKETISKNGLIKMTKSVNKVRTTIKATNAELSTNTGSSFSNLNIGKKAKEEYRHMYSIASFVDLFNDNDVDNNTQFVSIEKNKISLNTLFIQSSSTYVEWNATRIFFGKAKLKSISFDKIGLKSEKKNVVEIEFIDSKFPKIYSNITMLSKRATTSNILEYLDTDKYTTVYFRGKLLNSGNKFERFNDKVYKDLLFF
ncbi:hypothetical protein BFC22_11585 [Carnobacterium divergens]|uniref:hypothetical protein n=1 Tax=Carnobacterium divergens TaxID=2748 RepID=UPI000E76C51B|nr:hypothetical protein [Carnobacterium divergens]AOA00689.1 hypothetical protein BFC22_11585 [Carnobacterium divergens]